MERYNIGCCGCESLEGEHDAVVGVGATVLSVIEGRGEELTEGAVGLGNSGEEATVGDKGLVGLPTRMGLSTKWDSKTRRSAL